MTTRPRAFRLDAADAKPAGEGAVELPSGVVVREEPPEAVVAADGVPVLVERRTRFPFATLFWTAAGALVSLGVGLGIERLIADLFAAAPWLGWLALALLALALLALAGIVLRELRGVWRERRIETWRRDAADAILHRDGEAAKRLAAEVAAFYADRAGAPANLGPAGLADEIMEADDRLAVAERLYLAPLDADAYRAIAAASRQVSAVTALSPRAVVDLAFVVYAAARLLRRIAGIYGGRPGFFGSLRLARAALNHLVVTGGVAVTDGLLHQVLGLGLAARISTKLGEGALNGLMTARFGLAALEVCRPLPFIRETPPRLADVAGEWLPGRSDG